MTSGFLLDRVRKNSKGKTISILLKLNTYVWQKNSEELILNRNQKDYLVRVLEKYNMTNYKSVSILHGPKFQC